MDIVRIIYMSVLLLLFAISLSWTINERISYWPHIRRFGSWRILMRIPRFLRTRHPVEIYQYELKLERFLIFFFSWLILMATILITIVSMISYYYHFDDQMLILRFKNQILVPLAILVIPHLISRLIESMAFIIGPKEFFYCKTIQPKSFQCYLRSWKEENGFFDEDPASFMKNMKSRFWNTLVFLTINFSLILINQDIFS